MSSISLYERGLDDLVNVNSLFTIAVFIGLAYSSPDEESLDDRAECHAGTSIKRRLVIYEVVSFSFFLLSSLVAKTLKMHINIFKDEFKSKFCRVLRCVMLTLAALGSVVGCLFLLLSMLHLIEVRLGKLSCGSPSSWIAAGTLITVVSVALLFYLPTVVYVLYVAWSQR